MSPEVFITGIGIVSPAGLGTEETWQGLLAGGHYVQPAFDSAGCKTGLAASIRSFTPPRGTENQDRVCQLAVAAAEEAVGGWTTSHGACDPVRVRTGGPPLQRVRAAKAGARTRDFLGQGPPVGSLCSSPLQPSKSGTQVRRTWAAHLDPERVKVSVGTSKGGILSFAHLAPLLTEHRQSGQGGRMIGERSWHPDALLSISPDAPARCIAERFSLTAGMHATVGACSTGTLAVIRAAQMIQDGDADVVLCGSSDASLHPLWFAAFEQMGVQATEHPSRGPAWACRPFDRTRSGFALGEGAAILVLESGQSVRSRTSRTIARIAGTASGTDPAGLAQVSPDAEPLAHVIRLACQRAGCRPEDITCIHAHGTATPGNDAIETRAIQSALGHWAKSVPIVSIKGALGHLLGAAGAVEIAAAALTCREGVSPGTATLIEPDPRLGPLNLPREAFRVTRGPVLKMSLGFGGHVAAVVLAAV